MYYAGSPVTLFGTIYPPPSENEGIVVSVKNPRNVVVEVGQAQISRSSGSFSYVIGVGGTQNWLQGGYNATATLGDRSVYAIFWLSPARSGAGAPTLGLNVLAPPLVRPGDQVNIAVIASLPNGAPDNVTVWTSLYLLFPDGVFHSVCNPSDSSLGCVGTLARTQPGFYQIFFTLPSTAEKGTYFVEAAVTDSSGSSARSLGQFFVQ